MAYSLERRNKAMELRKSGLSYSEIQKYIPVTKGLLSQWFKTLVLTDEEKKNLANRVDERKARGKINTLIANRSKRIARDMSARKYAERLFDKNLEDPLFLAGLAFMWPKDFGKERYVRFMSSDPSAILLVSIWIQKFFSPLGSTIKFRLFISEENREVALQFWAKHLSVDVSRITATMYSQSARSPKKPLYNNGFMQISAGGVRQVSMMNAWKNLVVQYYERANMRPW
jgi:hypothetical protein